jgi:excinuclease ABC subunit B
MYADTITESMQLTIDETNRRRNKQLKYNEEHGITPKQIVKAINVSLNTEKEAAAAQQRTQDAKRSSQQPKPYVPYMESETGRIVADPIVNQMSREQLQKSIDNTTALMQQAAAELDFLQAAQYRDEILRLQALLDEKPATNS